MEELGFLSKTSTITNDPTFTKNCTTDVKIKSHVTIYVFQVYPCILIKDEILSRYFNTTIIMAMYISHLPFYISSLLRTSIATRLGHPIIWVTFCLGQRKSCLYRIRKKYIGEELNFDFQYSFDSKPHS